VRRVEDATLLALKVREGAMSIGCRRPLDNSKVHKMTLSRKECTLLTLGLVLCDSLQTTDLQNYKVSFSYFKPLNSLLFVTSTKEN
jgi:hypothetical protein